MEHQKVGVVCSGCAKNLVDAQVMLGVLADRGYLVTQDEKEADVIIVPTCTFVRAARHNSICAILDGAELKNTGRCHTLVVAGCLAQLYKEQLASELPEVDVFIGTSDYADIADILDARASTRHRLCRIGDPSRPQAEDVPRLQVPAGSHAYLKIAEGCSNRCSYCLIPQVRGQHRSRPLESLVAEAGRLASQGVKELVVIAQDPTKYGQDLTKGCTLTTLLGRLAAIDRLEWMWIEHANPDGVGDDLIALIRDEAKIRKFLSVQIQHISDPVLKRMNRRSSEAQIRALVEKLRREVPDLVLGTCVIVGFPGETEDDFHALMKVVEERLFDFMGVFPYSREEGTPAALMPDHVDEAITRARYMELSRARADLWPRRVEAFVGRTLDLIVEGRLAAPPAVARALATAGSAGNASVAQGVWEHREEVGGDSEDVLTLSGRLPAGLSEHIRLERDRRKLLALLCPPIKREFALLGTPHRGSVQAPGDQAPPVLAGRLPFQIPGQDSKTYIASGTAAGGEIVATKVLGVADYDLIGAVVAQKGN